MKQRLSIALIGLAFFGVSAAPAAAQSRIGFKLTGGLGYIGGGEVNRGFRGISDFYTDLAGLLGYSSQGGYQAFHFGLDLGGELVFQITPEIALGLGAGYLVASRSSGLDILTGTSTSTMDWEPKASAIPVTLNFHYFIPAGNRLKFVIHAGVGYYLAKLDAAETMMGDSSRLDMSGNGFGAHGGFGLELALSPNASLVFDALGRYASIGGWKGDLTYPGGVISGGKLWSGDLVAPFGTYPVVEFEISAPGGGITNVREAKLDFSGFSAVIGFLFRF